MNLFKANVLQSSVIKVHTFNSQENFTVHPCIYKFDFNHRNTDIYLSHCVCTFLAMLSFETSASSLVKKCFPF